MSNTTSYTNNDLIAVCVSKELRDNELGFVGTGTDGRAFTLAVGIPLVASRLAQMSHAPNYTIFWGNLMSPDLSVIPPKLTQRYLTRWPAAYQPITTADKCEMIARGGFDVSFNSAPQIDKYGNLNITVIGNYLKPKVRLIGCLAQPDHLAFVKRPIIIADLKPRTFVDKVDFITSAGYLNGYDSREKAGLRKEGPYKVITDKCIFNFEHPSRIMQIESLHPGVKIQDVLDLLGFQPIIPDNIPVTPIPTELEIKRIHEVIDPDNIFLRA